MLSNEDKKWIAEAISKVKNNKPVEKSYRTKDSAIGNLRELVRKRQQNAETLSERIALERAKLKSQLTKPIRNAKTQLTKTRQKLKSEYEKKVPNKDIRKLLDIAGKTSKKAVGAVATGVAGTVGTLGSAGLSLAKSTAAAARNTLMGIKSSRLSNSVIESIMYSNPLTAALYMNKDLLKGAFGGVRGLAGGIKNALGTGLKALGKTAGGIWNATKAVGGGLWDAAEYFYGKNKNKYKPPGTNKKELPDKLGPTALLANPNSPKALSENKVGNLLAKDCVNYIGLIKQAIFMGGTNYFYNTPKVNYPATPQIPNNDKLLPGTKALPFSNKTKSLPVSQDKKLLPKDSNQLLKLPDLKAKSSTEKIKRQERPEIVEKDENIIEMTKGINGIYEQSKKSNELLKKLGSKQLLIVVGVLAAVAAIAGLAFWLKNNLKLPKLPNLPKPPNTPFSSKLLDENVGFKMKNNSEMGKISRDDTISNYKSAIQKEAPITNREDIKNIYKQKVGSSFKSAANAPYRAPFDLVIKEVKNNDAEPNEYDYLVQRQDQKVKHDYWLMNISQPLYPPNEEKVYLKGTILGFVGKNGKINIKAAHLGTYDTEYESSYQDMVTKLANRNEQQKQKEAEQFDSQYDEDINNIRQVMFKTMNSKPVKDATGNVGYSVESIDKKKLEEALEKQKQEQERKNRPTFLRAAPEEPRINKDDWFLMPETKNTEKAKNQAKKNMKGKSTGGATPVVNSNSNPNDIQKQPTKISYHKASEPSAQYFAPQDSSDINAMYQDRLGIFTS